MFHREKRPNPMAMGHNDAMTDRRKAALLNLRIRYSSAMSTITAILEPHADGTLHLPLPPQLRQGKIKVEAKLEAADAQDADGGEPDRQRRLLETMERLRARNPFKEIHDPLAWQRQMRQDRLLPGRD